MRRFKISLSASLARDRSSSWIGWMILFGCGLGVAMGEVPFASDIQPLIQSHCAKCHGAEKPKGGVTLTAHTNLVALQSDPKLWETVGRVVREREMPPPGKPQPTEENRNRFLEAVQKAIEELDESSVPKYPGRDVLHRLSRLEYNNTIRDLLGVTTQPANTFPADGSGGGGFDNNSATLFVPPILMEKYVESAGEVLGVAKPETFASVRPGFFRTPDWAARKSLERFVTKAFRRPVDEAEIDPLVGLFRQAAEQGKSFDDAMRYALKAVLISPNFLYRVEAQGKDVGPHLVTPFELASRLSYFLWSSMPDEELFRLATQGTLSQPEILRRQVARMLLDPKAQALSESFVSQWLGIRSLKTTTRPDAGKFPIYTTALRDALCEEPVALFRYLVSENRSLTELVDADYTFLNQDLAGHYGIPGVTGSEFRKVQLADRRRGGVVTMGSVLTLTSYPLRTSPVLRGKWLLEEILGAPSPPPPPNVVSLSANDSKEEGLTFRQRLEKHRQQPDCAACHQRMDPLGFGLENFDPTGRWREQVGGEKVDSSGTMTSGERFDGPAELKKILVSRQDEFVRNLTEKMLAYALGRGLEYFDAPTVRQIAKTVKADHYRVQTLVAEVVLSYPFQNRSDEPMEQKRHHEQAQRN